MLLDANIDDRAALCILDLVDHNLVLLVRCERHARFGEDPRNVDFYIEIRKIKRTWLKGSIDLSKELSFHTVPIFIGFELKGRCLGYTFGDGFL